MDIRKWGECSMARLGDVPDDRYDDDYDDEDEDGDIIELTPELVLADIAALKPVLQQAIASGEKVHLQLLG